MTQELPPRRKRIWRIAPVVREWLRNPMLLSLPFTALCLGLLGDEALAAGFYGTSELLQTMANLSLLALGGLLLVAFKHA